MLLESEAGAELQKSARELFELANGEDFVAATNSLAAVNEIAKQVDFATLQQDLERIKIILVKVQELQAASKEVPPNVPLIQQKASEIDTEAQAAQGSIERLQKTAELVSKSQEDIIKVVGLSEEVQRRATALQPLVEPVQELVTCVDGAFRGFNWTMLHEMTGDENDGQSDWLRIFLQADEDSNGVVDRAEFARINWESHGTKPLEFAAIDHDASGAVEKQEWVSYKTIGAAVSEADANASNNNTLQAQSLAELEADSEACKAFLRKHECEKQLREYLPRYRLLRTVLQPLSDHEWLGPLQVEPEPDGALPQECELYSRVGCDAPQMQFLLRNSDRDLEKWRQVMDDGHARLNHTLNFTRTNADRLDRFATGTFRWASIVGNAVALVATLCLTYRLVDRFTSVLRNLRSGHPEGKLIKKIKETSGITAIQIPKLVGMVLMSFWITYVIIQGLVTVVLCFLFGPWLEVVFQTLGPTVLNLAVETILVFLLVAVGLDMIVGKKVLLGGTDDMLHPVLFTWYAVVMLLMNLIKGAALATTRIILMVILNVGRFAVLDQSTFPSGFEGHDHAYSAFVATVWNSNKYRHPIFTSLCVRHIINLKKKMEEKVTGSGVNQGAHALDDTRHVTGSDVRFNSWLAHDHPPSEWEGIRKRLSVMTSLRSRISPLLSRTYPSQVLDAFHTRLQEDQVGAKP
jgi:hypothetical protein